MGERGRKEGREEGREGERARARASISPDIAERGGGEREREGGAGRVKERAVHEM